MVHKSIPNFLLQIILLAAETMFLFQKKIHKKSNAIINYWMILFGLIFVQ